MKLAIDIDGTIADFVTPFITLCEEVSGETYEHYDTLTMPFWSVEDACGIDKHVSNLAWEKALTKADWWERFAPLFTLKDRLLILEDHGVDIYFVTARPKEVHGQTKRWISTWVSPYSGNYKTVSTGGGKNKVQYFTKNNFDAILEDKPENLIRAKEAGIKYPIAIDRTYNRGIWLGDRVGSVSQAIYLLVKERELNDKENL